MHKFSQLFSSMISVSICPEKFCGCLLVDHYLQCIASHCFASFLAALPYFFTFASLGFHILDKVSALLILASDYVFYGMSAKLIGHHHLYLLRLYHYPVCAYHAFLYNVHKCTYTQTCKLFISSYI